MAQVWRLRVHSGMCGRLFRRIAHRAWGHEYADMSQAVFRIGTRIAGASGGQYFVGDSNGEDQGCEVGQGNREAAELLPLDHRLGRPEEQQVDH